MSILERQPGVAEKGKGEVRLSPDAREASVYRLTQPGEVSGANVGQFPAFDVAPHLFDWVQLRGVPGQRFDRQPGALLAECVVAVEDETGENAHEETREG